METIGNSLSSPGLNHWLLFHRLSVPHNELSSLGLPIENKRHAIAIILLVGVVSWREENLTCCLCWTKVNVLDNSLFLMVILHEALEVKILLADSILRELLPKVRNIRVSCFLADVLLVYNWEFNCEIADYIFHFSLTSHEVEGVSSELACEVLVFEEGMLLIKGDLDVFLRASVENDDGLTLLVDLFPSVHVVEDVMCWQVKPLDLGWVLAKLLHDCVSGWLLLVKLEYEASVCHGFVWLELEGEVWNDNVIVSDWEVVDHS